MSVSSTATEVAYTADGITMNWGIPFYFCEPADLVVSLTDLSGHTTTQVFGENFVINGSADPRLGTYPPGTVTITFEFAYAGLPPPPPNPPVPAGWVITVTRNTPPTQLLPFIDNGAFSGAALEVALDKLTCALQDRIQTFLGVLGGIPTSGNYVAGQWAITPANWAPGGFFGIVCTASGNPGTWKPFAMISE